MEPGHRGKALVAPKNVVTKTEDKNEQRGKETRLNGIRTPTMTRPVFQTAYGVFARALVDQNGMCKLASEPESRASIV